VSNPPCNVSSDQQPRPGDGDSRTGHSGLRAETLAEGFAFLVVLTVAQRFIGLLREILFCRWLAPDELGQWSLSFGFFLLAAPLVVCGLPGSFGRYVAYYRERGQLRPFLVRTTTISGLLAAVGITLILVARRQVAWFIFDDPARADLVVLLALGLVSLLVMLAIPSLFGLLRKNTFRSGIRDFVSTMQMAATAAAESERRYEVIIDLDEQTYLLRQITSSDLTQILDEEIIIDNDFSERCLVSYVQFDDEEFTNEGRAKFRAGHSGWQYGGKIVILDEEDNPYSVVVNRVNRTVVLKPGDVEMLLPKRKDEVIF